MDGQDTGWDGRTADQGRDEARHIDKMAEPFGHHPALRASFAALARNARTRADDGPVPIQAADQHDWSCIRQTGMKSFNASDLDYFSRRAATEQAAAQIARDLHVREVHLEMAERYRTLIRASKARG